MAYSQISDNQYHILLVGMTGSGKSSTGNSILGKEAFLSVGGPDSCTREHHVGCTDFEGKIIKVVDIPGYADTGQTDQAGRMLVAKALTEALVKFPDGFDVVLLVHSYSSKLTTAESDGIRELLNLCDVDAFKSHGIVVISYADGFTRDKRKTGVTDVDQWRAKQSWKTQWLFESCSNRCLLFDNVTEDTGLKRDQLNNLLSKIDQIKRSTGRKYLPQICREHPDDLAQFSQDRQKVCELEKMCIYLNLICSKIDELHNSRISSETVSGFHNNAEQLMSIVMNLDKNSIQNSKYRLFFKNLNELDISNAHPKGKEIKKLVFSMISEIDKEIQSTLFWTTVERRIYRILDSCNIL